MHPYLYKQFACDSVVDTCTIVGQILRIFRKKTHYIHVMRTCIIRRMPSRIPHCLVDMENISSPSTPRIYPLSTEDCAAKCYLRSCGLLSTTVYFIDDDMGRLADNYLAWAANCQNFAEEPCKPQAVVVFCGQKPSKDVRTLAIEFTERCSKRDSQHERTDLCFSHTKVLYVPKFMCHCHTSFVNWALHESLEQQTWDTVQNQSLFSYWTEDLALHILSRFMLFYANYGDTRMFSMAWALSSSIRYQKLSSKVFLGSISTATCLLGKYMAYHLLSRCSYLSKETLQLKSASSMFQRIFSLRYAPIALHILGVHQLSIKVEDHVLEVEAHMRATLHNYLGSRERITQTHIAALQPYASFLRPDRMCAGCLFASWDDLLPCGHGFCVSCTHNYSYGWKQSSKLEISQCPLCLKIFGQPCRIKLKPPTAGCRVLSLDGGGVRGIVELEILQQLEQIVGGELRISELFDMIVGTSIGGIIALGLVFRRWDFEECKEKLATVSARVFPTPRTPSNWVAASVSSIVRYARFAACLALQSSLVGGDIINASHLQEFGADGGMLYSGATVRVAVTTCDARDSTCVLITSYNRSISDHDRPYRWLQSEPALRDVKVWEAARCTSAVPFLFPAARLRGPNEYYDGALAYNNPTFLAIEEAKAVWGGKDTPSTVLSVGCGITNDQKSRSTSPWPCIFGGFSAARQNKELLFRGYCYTRLDPCLNVESVSLDDVRAIPILQSSFTAMLNHDAGFTTRLRNFAFQLLSAIFYLEVAERPQLCASSEYSVMAMIRPRLPSSSLKHLYNHHIFGRLRFLVNGTPFTFSMPKKVTIRTSSLERPMKVLLSCESDEAPISGFPKTIAQLLEGQSEFYCRKGSRKRNFQDTIE